MLVSDFSQNRGGLGRRMTRWVGGWRHGLAVGAIAAGSLVCSPLASAAPFVALGDSLTAEYDVIPNIPGFANLPTDYAKVTVAGWEARSWVELLVQAQPQAFNFGARRDLPQVWSVPRVSGYEGNWAVPGITAGQYEDFVTATAISNAAYAALRQPLDQELRQEAQRVVIWLGTNEFRANYGALSNGANSSSLIAGLIDDLTKIVSYVQGRNSQAQIVLVNLPDPGATPDKKLAHPDPIKRARVTTAIKSANVQIAALAGRKNVALADAYSASERLVADLPFYFGSVRFVNASDADNNPRYLFTRDGLHPNTALQIVNARSIVRAFNTFYNAGLPTITDAQALRLLVIDSRQAFYEWLASFGLARQGVQADLDGDGLRNLVEYAFGMDPTRNDAAAFPVVLGGPVAGIPGTLSVSYRPDPAHQRDTRIKIQYSTGQFSWNTVSGSQIVNSPNGIVTAVIPPGAPISALRVKVILVPPAGSTATQQVVVPLSLP